MATTPNLGLPLIDGAMTADVPRDMNALANAVDTAVEEALADVSIPDASLTVKGKTQLSSATDSTLEDRAATPKAIKTVGDSLGTHTSGTAVHGAVSAATPSRLIIRDTVGRAQVAIPSAAADIARLDTVIGQVGVLSDLQTTAKGNAVAAINELFQSGVSAKQGIVDAINAMGGSASTSDSWSTLATKIQSISTGKKFANGTVTSSSSSRTFTMLSGGTVSRNFVVIAGLGFRPKSIFLRLTSLTNRIESAFYSLAATGGTEYGVMNNGDVPIMYELSGGATRSTDAYINDSECLLPVSYSANSYTWYAYGG